MPASQPQQITDASQAGRATQALLRLTPQVSSHYPPGQKALPDPRTPSHRPVPASSVSPARSGAPTTGTVLSHKPRPSAHGISAPGVQPAPATSSNARDNAFVPRSTPLNHSNISAVRSRSPGHRPDSLPIASGGSSGYGAGLDPVVSSTLCPYCRVGRRIVPPFGEPYCDQYCLVLESGNANM